MPGLTVHDLMLMPIARIRRFFDEMTLPSALLDDALKLLVAEVRTRLRYLCDVGLGYLTLDRQSRTLSGGEVQRINLTTALGTSLTKTLFVLDEPSIGLHPRDLDRIVEAMRRLRDAGNTLVVVEHDPSVMLAADRLIDMGPGPGERGGSIVFDGTPADIRSAPTLTGEYLGARRRVADAAQWARRPVEADTPRLVLEGASEHNLRDVTIEIPLARLVCVTGVSGSGKSTLVQDVLYPALARFLGRATEAPGAHRALIGAAADRRCRIRRPIADRQDRTLESRELCGRLRRNPQALRESAAGVATRLRSRDVQLQFGRWALPDLRRLGLRARRDAVLVRRVSALSGLRWPPLPRRSTRRDDRAGRACTRAVDRRRARTDR